MRRNRDLVPCPKCGEELQFRWGEVKKNSHLTLACPACGLHDLAVNIIQMAVYERLKELGHTKLGPPRPQPIDPITVMSRENGYEVVIRRYKNGRERMYSRKARRTPPT
jgi:hypothetical protein